VVALPLAAGVLAPWGILLSPAAGAVLMSASTIVVALNAQLLRRQRFAERGRTSAPGHEAPGMTAGSAPAGPGPGEAGPRSV